MYMGVWHPWRSACRPEEGIRSPRDGATGGLLVAWADAGNLARSQARAAHATLNFQPSPAPFFQELLSCLIPTRFWKIEKALPTEALSLKLLAYTLGRNSESDGICFAPAAMVINYASTRSTEITKFQDRPDPQNEAMYASELTHTEWLMNVCRSSTVS